MQPHRNLNEFTASDSLERELFQVDVRGYYRALGIAIPDWSPTEASVHCFADPDAHRRGDRNRSCSINLDHGAWRCHGCGARGGAYDAATSLGLSSRAAIDLMILYGLTTRRRLARPGRGSLVRRRQAGGSLRQINPFLGASERDVRHWKSALAEQPELIARLTRERCWLYSTMLDLELGFDCGRITIPVRDEHQRLAGVLRYRPGARDGQTKMHAARGSRRLLLPNPAHETAQRLLLVEGEPDMIAARSQGFPAIALPGANSWRPEWARLLSGRRIAVVMDADPEGRSAAARIAFDLRKQATVTVRDLAPGREDGYDLTDLLRDDRSAAQRLLP